MNIIYLLPIIATLVFTEEIPKRTPIGFSGVRGKKFASYLSNYDLEDQFLNSEESFNPDEEIVGGGRVEEEDPTMLNRFLQDKRSVYGFVGMRGKKTPWEDNRKVKIVDSLRYDGKRAPYAFLGMRGKKEKISSLYKAKDQYGDKRAPMGFIGMRGKKSYIIDENVKTN